MKALQQYNFSLILVVLFLLVLFIALMFSDRISIIGNTIFSKKETTCAQGWICLDEKTSAYQKGNCDISYEVECFNVCEDGMCK